MIDNNIFWYPYSFCYNVLVFRFVYNFSYFLNNTFNIILFIMFSVNMSRWIFCLVIMLFHDLTFLLSGYLSLIEWYCFRMFPVKRRINQSLLVLRTSSLNEVISYLLRWYHTDGCWQRINSTKRQTDELRIIWLPMKNKNVVL